MSDKLNNGDIPTLDIPTIKPQPSEDASAEKDIQALKAMFGVKLDQMRQDYEKRLADSGKEQEALLSQAQAKIKTMHVDHQTQLESLHAEFQAQLENVHHLNKQQLQNVQGKHLEDITKMQQVQSVNEQKYHQALSTQQLRLEMKDSENQKKCKQLADLTHQLYVALSAESLQVEGVNENDQAFIQRIKQLCDRVAILDVELNYRNEQLALYKS